MGGGLLCRDGLGCRHPGNVPAGARQRATVFASYLGAKGLGAAAPNMPAGAPPKAPATAAFSAFFLPNGMLAIPPNAGVAGVTVINGVVAAVPNGPNPGGFAPKPAAGVPKAAAVGAVKAGAGDPKAPTPAAGGAKTPACGAKAPAGFGAKAPAGFAKAPMPAAGDANAPTPAAGDANALTPPAEKMPA